MRIGRHCESAKGSRDCVLRPRFASCFATRRIDRCDDDDLRFYRDFHRDARAICGIAKCVRIARCMSRAHVTALRAAQFRASPTPVHRSDDIGADPLRSGWKLRYLEFAGLSRGQIAISKFSSSILIYRDASSVSTKKHMGAISHGARIISQAAISVTLTPKLTLRSSFERISIFRTSRDTELGRKIGRNGRTSDLRKEKKERKKGKGKKKKKKKKKKEGRTKATQTTEQSEQEL